MSANFCQNCGSKLTGAYCQNCKIDNPPEASLDIEPKILSESYSSNSKVSRGRLLLWSIIGGLCFFFYWINKSLDDDFNKKQLTVYGEVEKPSTGREKSQKIQNTQPSRAERLKARRGDVLVLKDGAPCMFTKEGLDDVERWHSRGDNLEAATAMVRHGGILLKQGDSVKIMDPGIIRTEVRPVNGIRTCFVLRERLTKGSIH